MKRFVIMILVATGCLTRAGAQTFTQSLQSGEPQWGTVTIHHSKDIDAVVNGKGMRVRVIEENDSTATAGGTTTDGSAIKANGYRVQLLAGGNSRDDKMKVTKAGNEVKALFPDEAVYVLFQSPRWICRVGNYRTYEEAYHMLLKVQAMGYRQATIIKGKISLKY